MIRDIPDFVAHWQQAALSERSGSQSHFIDLCHALQQPTPTEADPAGTWYAFEKGALKSGGKRSGQKGWADVWMREHFAWEYKGQHKDLIAAYNQLLQYREDLGNPPLLVVSDMLLFEVHTNFTNTAKSVYRFSLNDLVVNKPTGGSSLPPLEVLRLLFDHPDRLKPQETTAQVTERAAQQFAKLAEGLHKRGADPLQAAHFLMRLLFCLFAEDIDLLPEKLFTRLLSKNRNPPQQFSRVLRQLFAAMSSGDTFGADPILYFDGGLFNDDSVLELTAGELNLLQDATALDWSSIEPAIFGTLFERGLDPANRTKLGAHYTSREDIVLITEPVLMAPLRRRWATVQEQAGILSDQRDAATGRARDNRHEELRKVLQDFHAEIAEVQILDPACGSGNFLYVALKQLLDLQKEVSVFGASHGLITLFPTVRPEQLHGIELNPYAQQLASVVVWIGYIQWMRDNGFGYETSPVLRPLENIKLMDAILALDDSEQPVHPPWPPANVVLGNPPFLGGNKIRKELGDTYVDALFRLYENNVPAFADLVCYWFERARELIAQGHVQRVGLLATNSIRGGANRHVLERIKETGDIFWAESDRQWILKGASVRVSMIGFDNGTETERVLDKQSVQYINPDLTPTVDLTLAQSLKENLGICFMGPSPKAPFDITSDVAQQMLKAPVNVNSRPNSDVVRPVASAVDLIRQPRNEWTIDFGLRSLEEASEYEQPFEYVKTHVYPIRTKNRRAAYAEKWWQYAEARPGMRAALQAKSRFVVTPSVSKYRLFVWVDPAVLCNQGTLVFARDDDYFFGALQSKPHTLWALRVGTALEDRPRYTPTTCFETFPLPWPPGREPHGDPRVEEIAASARELVVKRDAWLNPPGASFEELKGRTLTKLYNLRPTWLEQAHAKLDKAVLAAYGWPEDLADEEILERLLAMNKERVAGQGARC